MKENIKRLKEQFITSFKRKEQEISILKNKIQSQEEIYTKLKAAESELLKSLNSKGKTLGLLEQRKKNQPLSNYNENSAKKIKLCEEKVSFYRNLFNKK